jgi:hypothetical protein
MNFTPAAMPSASLTKCGVVPAPPVPYVTDSGWARAAAIRSPRVLYFASALTTTPIGAKT